MAREAAFLGDLGWAVGRRQDPGGRPPTEKAGTEAWEWGGLGARNQDAFRASKKRPSPPRAFWEPLQKIYNRRVTPPCRVGHLSGDANDLLLSALLGCHQLLRVLLITHVYTVLQGLQSTLSYEPRTQVDLSL